MTCRHRTNGLPCPGASVGALPLGLEALTEERAGGKGAPGTHPWAPSRSGCYSCLLLSLLLAPRKGTAQLLESPLHRLFSFCSLLPPSAPSGLELVTAPHCCQPWSIAQSPARHRYLRLHLCKQPLNQTLLNHPPLAVSPCASWVSDVSPPCF